MSPALWGRVDQVKYATGLRTCKNFWVMRHGGLANRPGTAFLAEVKDSTEKTRLIPFVFNPSQTYVLEFGDQYMRVYRNGAQVMDGESPYEIATPYVEADLSELQYIQSADVVTLVHPNYAPRELKRTGHTSWTLSTITFGASIAAPTGVVVSGGSGVPNTPTGLAATGGSGSESYKVTAFNESPTPRAESKASSEVSASGSGGNVAVSWNAVAGAEGYALYKYDGATNKYGLVYVGLNTSFTDTSGAAVPATSVRTAPEFASGSNNYNYKVTAVDATTSEESLPSSAAGVTSAAAVSTSNPLTVSWDAVTGAGHYNVYREINGQYGWIGVAGGTSFKDTGYTPDVLDTPPVDRQPFTGAGNYPSTATYYQQRRVFANTDNNPEGVWTSKSALHKNFMISTPLQDDDAVTFSLVGKQVNEVRHLLEVGKLVAFTASGEYSIEGDPAGILVPGGVNPKQHTANGSGSLPPLVVDGSALYVQARGSVVRDLAFNFDTDGYRGNELSIFAAHLIDGYTIVDWAYQQIPHSIVWAVRDDGVLLGLTYIREHQVFGWHRHEFDGFVESVCVVPEGTEDALYLVVRRTIDGEEVRYIERMHTRQIDDIVDAVFLDCSLTYDGRNTGATTMTLSGGTTWTHGESLDLESSEAFFAESDIGNAIHLTLNGDTVRCAITAFTDDQNVTVNPHKTVPEGMRDAALATWSRAVDEVAGLDHLEGKAVSIFADGFVVANPNNPAYVERTVSSGAVTLDKPYSVIHVGLPITATMETLNIDNLQGPSLADRKKHVSKLTAIVESSRGIWAGIDEDGLTEYKARNDEGYDDPVALTTGTVDINIQPEWNSTGKVMIRQVDPLPLSILSVIPSGFIAG